MSIGEAGFDYTVSNEKLIVFFLGENENVQFYLVNIGKMLFIRKIARYF